MGAISELSTAGGVVRSNPILFVATLIAALFGQLFIVGRAAGGAAGPLIGLLGGLITFLLSPFLLGGILGMAEEGLSGTTGLQTLIDEGADNYLSILGASILVGVLVAVAVFVYVIILVIVAAILGVGTSALVSGGDGATAGLGLGVVLVLLLFVLLAIPLFFFLYLFVYFFDVAIVMDNENAVDGIKRSVGFVRRNLASTVGFFIITGILGLIASIPSFWLSLTRAAPFSTVVTLALATVVLSTFISAFTYAYKVALYDDLTGTKTDRVDVAD